MKKSLIVVSLSKKESGGGQQLRFAARSMAQERCLELKEINLFRDENSVKINLLFFLFIGSCILRGLNITRNYHVIYSDPIFSFLDLLMGSSQATRYVQSIDELLYDSHPKLNKLIIFILRCYIIFCTRYGRNRLIVNSQVCANYVISYGRTFESLKPSLIVINPKKLITDKKQIYIVSLMSNPAQKGISQLLHIALDFPHLTFIILSQVAIHCTIPSNVVNFVNLSRFELNNWLFNAKAHLCVSVKESIGLPIYEAMALNVPSIFLMCQATDKASKAGLAALPVYEYNEFNTLLAKIDTRTFHDDLIKRQLEFIDNEFSVHYV
jgi:hypothetical protein